MHARGGGRATWGQVFGSCGRIDGNGNAVRLKRDIGGFVVGADPDVSAGRAGAGALAGYSRASTDTDARNSGAKTDTSRSVAFAGFADSVSAKYDSTTMKLFATLAHMRVKSDAFRARQPRRRCTATLNWAF
ncbi:autotransporter domain-containing protein [Variovorax sp. MHTC-1]|uniref:autotransporter domain-containing protein n=1 Tax=Variovorax sp. MHTC-1 TaxID=2495593 RepID=UPI0021AF3B2F|nr:autotransporter domain-containing protein [Variovorax sp. MHTC-1]